MAIKESKRHQMLQAVRTVSIIMQFLDKKFDFSTAEGKDMLNEAKEACLYLEKEIDSAYPKK
jgi:hypothetical protein